MAVVTRRSAEILAQATFGDFSRYCLAVVLTRFDKIEFQVSDAERPDDDGMPRVIRQTETIQSALEGMEGVECFSQSPCTEDFIVTLGKTPAVYLKEGYARCIRTGEKFLVGSFHVIKGF